MKAALTIEAPILQKPKTTFKPSNLNIASHLIPLMTTPATMITGVTSNSDMPAVRKSFKHY